MDKNLVNTLKTKATLLGVLAVGAFGVTSVTKRKQQPKNKAKA